MMYREIKVDLFGMPSNYILVHCISSDFAMGAGIAKDFRDKYRIKAALCNKYDQDEWYGHGYCHIVIHPSSPWTVANLVTKKKYSDKPTYTTLKEALLSFKGQLLRRYPDISDEGENPMLHIAMPLIGCGLDRLDWPQVSDMVKRVFKDLNIEVVVCRRD